MEYVPLRQRAKIVEGKAYVGKVGEIPPGRAKAIVLDKFRIAVFNVDGVFYAVKDACPHAEYPLSKGVVRGEVVTCASHSWQFNLKTGQCLKGDETISIRTFPVLVEGDSVWVRI